MKNTQWRLQTFKNTKFHLENDTVLEEESDDCPKGYMNALSAQQRQYSLRNRDVTISPIQKRKELQMKNDAEKKGKELANPSSSKAPTATNTSNEKNQQSTAKEQSKKKDPPIKEVEKSPSFNLENEISKLKVSMALTELVKNNAYKSQVYKVLQIDSVSDMVNVEDDYPELIFGPATK